MTNRAGDQVLATLARDRGPDLTSYAYLLTGQLPAAQDLVQEAFLRVFSRTRTGFAPEVAEAYVRRTMLTLYIDGYRRRRHWASVRHLVAAPSDGRPDPQAAAADRLDLYAALATLPPQERACVVLRFYEDLTVPEIADQMGLAQGTVKRYLSNAVHRLETRLGRLRAPATDEIVPVLRGTDGTTRS